jgi:hypothetical protein
MNNTYLGITARYLWMSAGAMKAKRIRITVTSFYPLKSRI